MKLKDVCLLIVDCPHSTAPNEGEGYPLIRTPNIERGRFNLDNVQRVSKKTYDRRNVRAIPQDNDLILAREAPAGNIAIIKNGMKVCLGQRTVLLRPNMDLVDPDFLLYFLLAPKQQNNLLGNANGSTVAHVNMPIIRNLSIELPSLKKQKRIGQILSAYDDLIENNRRQIKLLEEAAERLYKEWFVKFHYPGWENHFHDGKEEGWRNGTLSDIGKFNRGKTIISANIESGPIPVIAGGISPSFYCNEYNVIGPVITISASGANAGYVNLYHENIWASDCSFLEDSATKYLYWIYCFLKSNPNILINLQKGSAQPHVYAKDVNQIELLIPPERILTSFESEVAALYSQIAKFDRMIPLLLEARDRLLPKLMSGEVEV